MNRGLTDQAREAVRKSVRQVLTIVGPELEVGVESHGIPGDAGEIYDHIDGLVQITRRTRGDDVQKYLAQLPQEVCHDCRHQFENGFCPLRHRRMCALQIAATPVFEAVAGALENIEDPEYCAAHDEDATIDETEEEACAAGCDCGRCEATIFFG